MNTEITDVKEVVGWVLYDADCRFCTGLAKRFRVLLAARHFELLALQTPWVRQKLDLADNELLAEMRLLKPDGTLLGGVDALLEISRPFPLAWPIRKLAQIAAIKLPDPHHWLARETARLGPLNLTPPIDKILASAGQRLEILGTRLEGSNYEKLLARGFAMVRDAAGKPVTKAAGLTPDEKLDLHFADGHVPVQVAPK